MDETFLQNHLLPDWDHENILDRIISRFSSGVDMSQGSFHFDLSSNMALEFEKAAVELAYDTLMRSLPHFAYGEYLDMRVAEVGIHRRPAAAAKGEIFISGSPGTLISSGVVLKTTATADNEAIEFRTIEENEISGTGEVGILIEALTTGTEGNVPAGSIRNSDEMPDGVESIINRSPTQGGLEEEDDDTLRVRFFEEAKRRDGDGNIADYIAWAKEVPGVGNVLPEPLWMGPGTMRIVILDVDGMKPSEEIVNAVQNHLDPNSEGLGKGKAPMGHKITVQGPVEIIIAVTVPDLQHEPGYTLTQVKENVEESLRQTFIKASPGSVIRVRDVGAGIIQTAGVLDVGDIVLNGKRENIALNVDEKADVGEVIFT